MAQQRVIMGEAKTELGAFGVLITEAGLARMTYPGEGVETLRLWIGKREKDVAIGDEDPRLDRLAEQLSAYLAGELRTFDVDLDLRGTPFQLLVWQALLEIRYGETRSYGRLAEDVGRSSAARAVGAANGANPIPIIVPCHRLIGSNGRLTGYAGGLALKRRLLELEGAGIS